MHKFLFLFSLLFPISNVFADASAAVERTTRVSLSTPLKSPSGIALAAVDPKGVMTLNVLTESDGAQFLTPIEFAPPSAVPREQKRLRASAEKLSGIALRRADGSIWLGKREAPEIVHVSKTGEIDETIRINAPAGKTLLGVLTLSFSPFERIYVLLETADGGIVLAEYHPENKTQSAYIYPLTDTKGASFPSQIAALSESRLVVSEERADGPPQLFLVDMTKQSDGMLHKERVTDIPDAMRFSGLYALPNSRTLLAVPAAPEVNEVWMVTLSRSLAQPVWEKALRAIILFTGIVLGIAAVRLLFVKGRVTS
jgi:hypothetical protein